MAEAKPNKDDDVASMIRHAAGYFNVLESAWTEAPDFATGLTCLKLTLKNLDDSLKIALKTAQQLSAEAKRGINE
jgi:hypothetical protein